MGFQPLRGEPHGLRAFPDIPDHVGSQKRQFDKLLNAPLRGSFSFRDVRVGLAGSDHVEVPMRQDNVPEQGLIAWTRATGQDQPCFNATLPMPEVRHKVQKVFRHTRRFDGKESLEGLSKAASASARGMLCCTQATSVFTPKPRLVRFAERRESPFFASPYSRVG